MSAHTPGPWELGDENNNSAEVDLGRGLTASLDRADRFSGRFVIEREEMLANARLISAAPDLLEAAEADDYAATLEAHPDSQLQARVARERADTLRRAAIAKAVGK